MSGWTFDRDDLAGRCDTEMRFSIPNYQAMRQAVRDVFDEMAPASSRVVELGAAAGDGIADLLHFSPKAQSCRFYAVESASAMARRLRERFEHEPRVRVVERDAVKLATERFEERVSPNCGATLAVLTLQFIPNTRLVVIDQAFRETKPGGIFILVEKVRSCFERNEDAFANIHRRHKRIHFSDAEIDAKEKALESVLVPLTSRENVAELEWCGFRNVECFWRYGRFAAFVGRKL